MAQTQQQHESEAHEKHGNSVAAWAGVTVMMVGFLAGAIGVASGQVLLLPVGGVVVVAGVVLGKVLTSMGLGVSGKPGA